MLLLGSAFACLALLVAGCGDGGSTDSTAASTDAETEATETDSTESTESESTELATTTPGEAPFEALTDTGEVPIDGAPDPNLSVAEVAEKLPLPEPISDDTAFTDALGIFVAASYKYFGESIELLGKPYHLPDELIAYDGATGDEGPDCFGEPTGAQNAAYCPPDEDPNGFIAWDETGLLEPFYDKLGDGAIAFVIGHEFAHLAQYQLGVLQKFPLTVEKELNADCLTGSLWGDFGRAGVDYTRTDIKTFIDGITVVGDQPGTPWQNQHAHGNAEERMTAFFYGFKHGFDPCMNAYGPGFSHGHR